MVSDRRFPVMAQFWASCGLARNHPSSGQAFPPGGASAVVSAFVAFRKFIPRGPRERAGGEVDGEFQIVQIVVRDNNVDQALKALKKKMQREGVFREMKARTAYEKPSEAKARRKAESVRRARKLARKRAQREGLLPKPVATRT